MNNVVLPITAFKDSILDAVAGNSVVIITAETGAGKSTQVPQYLLDAGYSVLVTQPRRLAVYTVSERVAEEYGCELGTVVGFKTSRRDRYSNETQCLFVTDGLAMVRELLGQRRQQVLVIDEVHEWNRSIETLVAWVKYQISLGADFKVVLMSATLEAGKLSVYFGGAPIISVPGRTYHVEEVMATVAESSYQAEQLLRMGMNVLLFEAGKREITDSIYKLKESRVNAEIIPLHGELEPEEQAKAFRSYGRPKCIIATNVAQTSITVPDIDAVVDTGLERRIEVVDGVEGLYLKPISLADRNQRKGRAGRTKPGIYIDMCPAKDEERGEFPKAEILRTRLDQTVLHLAIAGIDMEGLRFFHQPDIAEIHEAKRALIALGCLTQEGVVTDIGHKVARLPISVKYARMIVEADRLGVVDDVITITAILEMGEVTERLASDYEYPKWKSLVSDESVSDALAQLAVYKAAFGKGKDWHVENGIYRPNFFKVKDLREHLVDVLRDKISIYSSGNREAILKSICSGMVDHVFQNSLGFLKNGDNTTRRLNRGSVVSSKHEWLVGVPLDIEIKVRFGTTKLSLVRMATAIDQSWLIEIAPQLVSVEYVDPVYDPVSDVCTVLCRTKFNDQVLSEVREAKPDHPEAPLKFAEWLMKPYCPHLVADTNRRLQRRAEYENMMLGCTVHKVYTPGEYTEFLIKALGGAGSFRQVVDIYKLFLPSVLISDEMMKSLYEKNRDNRRVLISLGYTPPITENVTQHEKDKVEAEKLQVRAKELYTSNGRFDRKSKERLHKYGYQFCPVNNPSQLRVWVEEAKAFLAKFG